ncbi:MAG TPA: hypothetical protein VKA21_07115, partial [Candidatus Binatia bacterium]|nr:hypothetical protein [Candidatus Binatia bacterium]
MQAVHVLALVVALLVLPARADAHRRGRPERVSCPTDVAAAVAERCPCDGARNHGQYVLCVARYAAALRKARCIADAWSFTRCAARSTCGKSTAVVCCLAQPGTCTAGGVCDDDGETACTTDADCTTVRARIARDAGRCTAAGGVLGAGDSVCGGCAATTTSTTTTTTEPTTTSTIPTTTSTSTTTTVTVTTTTTTT